MRLILVPTVDELVALRPFLPEADDHSVRVELCGFGPIAAAARTAALIAHYQPARVMLLGIAGTFHTRLAIGSAVAFARVACHGIGRGTADAFESAAQMGWSQWSDSSREISVDDVLPLALDDVVSPSSELLLTACSASGSVEDAERRLRRYPTATAEDMEGFGVATACCIAGVELQVIRGISNQVGNVNRQDWQVDEALWSVGNLAQRLLGR